MIMKKMKLVSCLMAMAMAASAATVAHAADGTVAVTVGTDTQAPGAAFSVDVNLGSVPAGGLSSIDFAIDYDDAIIDVTDVKLGSIAETGAASAEGDMGETLFTWNDTGSQIVLAWATGMVDSAYWIKNNGVFVTISGTVDADAAAGSSTALTVSAADRETYPGSGVASTITISAVGESSTANYDCNATAGSVTVAGGAAAEANWGDVDCNGEVKIADVILLNRFIGEDTTITVTPQGLLNADCAYDGAQTGDDSTAILKYLAGMITYDQLGPQ